jgi:transcriptional regulator with XRE-family HTH domain
MYIGLNEREARRASERMLEKANRAEEIFPGRMRDMRQRAGISQRQLSEITCIEKTAISMYERGNRMPTLHNLMAISAVLQVSVSWLLGEV